MNGYDLYESRTKNVFDGKKLLVTALLVLLFNLVAVFGVAWRTNSRVQVSALASDLLAEDRQSLIKNDRSLRTNPRHDCGSELSVLFTQRQIDPWNI